MYNFLKLYVGSFWTFQIALIMTLVSVKLFMNCDKDEDKKGFWFASGIIVLIDATLFAIMAIGILMEA